ncbi:MAG TPA: glycine oxidase ThiO [Blastocatellia bacterium]|nr:glycine oxidase ThiO [Blastocatellia bacterium]
MSTDAIVVGGGVIGCTIAWRLAQQGLKVRLFERGKVGDEASRAAAGMLSPQAESQSKGPFFDLCLKSRLMYREFADELSDVSGIDVEYNDSGTLFVVLSGEDDEETTRWAAWQTEAGLPLQPFSEDDIRRIEPAVTESATRAIFLPEEHQVENRRLMDSLKIAIGLAGVELVEDAEVTSLATAQNRVTGVISAGKRFDTGSVIVAAGTWSSRLLEPLGLNVKVIPARGQMIAVKGDGCPITRVVHSSSVYVVPRRDGRILIGATVEYTGFKKEVTVSAINHLLKAGLELVPSLGQFAVVETWSGLRPDTIDHLPIIGPSGIDNLILATGHFRNGILLAPVTAELVADTVVQGRVSDDLKPFGVSRFDA